MKLDIPAELLPDRGVEAFTYLVGELRERYQGRRLYVERVDHYDPMEGHSGTRVFRVLVRGPASANYGEWYTLPPSEPWVAEVAVALSDELRRPGAMVDAILGAVLREARRRGWDLPVFRVGRSAKRLTR